MGRSGGPGWGWAMYEHGKLSAKEAALWAGRQAEVKKVRCCPESLCTRGCGTMKGHSDLELGLQAAGYMHTLLMNMTAISDLTGTGNS